jgi:hypothetical protein
LRSDPLVDRKRPLSRLLQFGPPPARARIGPQLSAIAFRPSSVISIQNTIRSRPPTSTHFRCKVAYPSIASPDNSRMEKPSANSTASAHPSGWRRSVSRGRRCSSLGFAIILLYGQKRRIGPLSGQCPKPVTQHGFPKTAAPWIDPAQDLVGRPKEKSGFEIISRATLNRSDGRPTQIRAPATITIHKERFGA